MTEPSTPSSAVPSTHRPPSSWRRRMIRTGLVLVVLALAAAGAGAFYCHYAARHATTDEAFIEGRVVVVSPRVSGQIKTVRVQDNQPVQRGDMLFELDPADFQAAVDQAQAALDSAVARQQAAQNGVQMMVVTTQVSARGARETLAASQDAQRDAQTAAAAAQAQNEQARTQAAAAEVAAAAAHTQLTAAETQAQKNQADLDRLQRLLKRQGATLQEVSAAKAALANSTTDLDAARKLAKAADAAATAARTALATAQETQNQAQADLIQAEAAVKDAQAKLAAGPAVLQKVAAARAQATAASADAATAQAALQQAQLALSYATITAPATGRIARPLVEVGSYVRPGQPLLTLVEPEVWVVAYFKETQLARLRLGQNVTLRAAAYPDVTFHGLIRSIEPATTTRLSPPPENAPRHALKGAQRVAVKIVFDPPPDTSAYRLLPGMSVVAVVDTADVAPPPPPAASAP